MGYYVSSIPRFQYSPAQTAFSHGTGYYSDIAPGRANCERSELVSIHKWPFSAISASNCGFACATYLGTPPHNPLFSLTLQKIAHF
jgi:hypothetical protein